jgi:6-phosphogluconolactonase/glucosamine-6-phosphate isomerase/deaminase
MLSGGSALTLLDFIPTEVLGANLTITTLDERYSIDPLINNFAQLEATDFYQRAQATGASFISTRIVDGETRDTLRHRFEYALREWRGKHSDGVIIATMGVGPDGHTAGIFAGDYGVDMNGESWVVAYEVPSAVNPYSQRITITNTFLRQQVDSAIVYAVGREKYAHLKCVQAGEVTVKEVPAAILGEMKSVKVFAKS